MTNQDRALIEHVRELQAAIAESYIRMATHNEDGTAYIDQQEKFCRDRLAEIREIYRQNPELFIEHIVMVGTKSVS